MRPFRQVWRRFRIGFHPGQAGAPERLRIVRDGHVGGGKRQIVPKVLQPVTCPDLPGDIDAVHAADSGDQHRVPELSACQFTGPDVRIRFPADKAFKVFIENAAAGARGLAGLFKEERLDTKKLSLPTIATSKINARSKTFATHLSGGVRFREPAQRFNLSGSGIKFLPEHVTAISRPCQALNTSAQRPLQRPVGELQVSDFSGQMKRGEVTSVGPLARQVLPSLSRSFGKSSPCRW
jgi:hypothetical protein